MKATVMKMHAMQLQLFAEAVSGKKIMYLYPDSGK